MAPSGPFKVAITGDFRDKSGAVSFDDDAMARLEASSDIAISVLDTPVGAPIAAPLLCEYDAIVMKRSPLSAETVAAAGAVRTRFIARNGVGIEHIALEACSRAGILVANTPEAVRRPLASAALAFILNLAHGIKQKDASLRAEGWAGRFRHPGVGLADRTLGVVGCGNIGQELLALIAPFGMECLAAAPSKTDAEVARHGATRVPLDTLLARSDFVALCCPLTAETHKMINAASLARMKPGSYLVNIGRGALVEEKDLLAGLESGHLAGAALDVFDPEPTAPDNPLLALPNVIVTAHNAGITDENMRRGNSGAATAVLAFVAGERPHAIVNPDALDHPRLAGLAAAAPT
ncbi:MAG: NAD(P)-dependent oxidoreductase [Acuticoccus sp.]